ncbi:MAG: hypothetical protein ACFFDH_25115 [Promethearchaeota archaeon]
MTSITRKNLEIELKKRGWEQYFDFAVDELKKGTTLKAVFKAIADKDLDVFIENLEHPKKLYLPESYKQGEAKIILGGKEKKEGYLEVKGKMEIVPKCHQNQIPYRKGNIIACTDDPEENIE